MSFKPSKYTTNVVKNVKQIVSNFLLKIFRKETKNIFEY